MKNHHRAWDFKVISLTRLEVWTPLNSPCVKVIDDAIGIENACLAVVCLDNVNLCY